MCCETKIRYVLYFFEWLTVRNTQHREYSTAEIPNDQNTQQKSWVFWSLGIPGKMTGIPNNGMLNDGIPNSGILSVTVWNTQHREYPTVGIPNDGMPNDGIPNNGIPNNGMSSNHIRYNM